MAENNEGWEVWAERLPDVETKQELPEGVWEDYKKYQMLNNREGDWSAPEMKNPDALTKIRNLMGKVKDLPDTMSYYAHKVADPMYANVDYMGQQVGDWAAKKINNIARAFDVSPEARQYGRFEEEEYDPEAVDVRFGRNAYKEGYDNLGDYLEAKDQEKVDRYRGYNHANRFAPIENADEQFYTLSDTQTMEDWKPETTSGKIAKGAIETAGNMLPENLKALMEEKGIEGGAKMLGTLSPAFAQVLSGKKGEDGTVGRHDYEYYKSTGKVPKVSKGEALKEAMPNKEAVALKGEFPEGYIDRRPREKKIYDYFRKHPAQAERYRERLTGATEEGGAVARAINDDFVAQHSKAEEIMEKAQKMAKAMDEAYGGSGASPFDVSALSEARSYGYNPIFEQIYKDVGTGLYNDEELVFRALMRNPSRFNSLNKQALLSRMSSGFGNPYEFKKANDTLDVARDIQRLQGKEAAKEFINNNL